MDASLNIAIAAEFDLCEKIAEALEQTQLEIEKVSIVEIYPFEWESVNYLLFAGQIEQAPLLAQAAESGCVVVDLKGICSALSDVPVVVPTINEQNLTELRQRNIVSLPDPQVSQLALSLASITQQTNLTQVFATSLLPASYTNGETVNKLAGQTARLLNGMPLEEGETRFAFDVFPQQATNLNLQLQKIFPQLDNVIFHQIQVPVFYGMAQKVTALADYEFDFQPQNPLIELHDSLITPVINGENENAEEEGVKLHISQQSAVENGIEFWTVADEQRFNIALLGVKLLEAIYYQGY